MPASNRSASVSGRRGRAGAYLLWFATLGGSTAWAVHLMAAWGVVELACAHGSRTVLGLSIRGFAGVATVAPGLLAVASLAAAWWLWTRRLRGGEGEVARARFMAQIGFWADLFAVLMIVLGGVAVLVFPPCAT